MRTRPGAAVKSAFLTVALVILVAPSAEAASVRFVHASPGTGPVEARVASGGAGEPLGPAVAFGEATPYRTVPAGRVELSIRSQDGGERVTMTDEPLTGNRRYTAVALGERGDLELRVYPDRPAAPQVASLRIIQAAPELGEAQLRVGEETVAGSLAYRDATPYRSVEPGTYELAAARPDEGGEPIVVERGVPLRAGTASTAILVGSAGERARFVLLDESTAAGAAASGRPAPPTGLGGLAGEHGPSWPLVLAAMLAAGALGGGLYRAASAGGTQRRRAGDR